MCLWGEVVSVSVDRQKSWGEKRVPPAWGFGDLLTTACPTSMRREGLNIAEKRELE